MNLNQVNVVGNLVRDPEVKVIASGTSLCNVTVAVNNRVKVKEEWKDEPCFLDVTVWGKTAEFVGEYLGKGDPVFISGRLKQENWEDKDTKKPRSKIAIVADQVMSLRFKGKDEQAPSNTSSPSSGSTSGAEEVPF